MAEQRAGKPGKSFVTLCLMGNIVLSISIVMLNKTVYTYYGFPNITMTCIHFIFTSVGMYICRCLGIFEPKSLSILKMLPISLTFCGFVVLTNLSLQSNTVGTYQIIKCMTMPIIMLIQFFFYSRSFSTRVKLTLLPISFGVFMNSYYDIKFNVLGTVFASAGVLVTSLYQVWIAEKQKEFQVNSMQLLYYQAPLSAICVAFVIPAVEPVTGAGGIMGPWPLTAVLLILLTAVIAFAINLSIFWIIGNTSPITYNMVGHLKFGLTVLGGFIVFSDPINMTQLLGIISTFGGVIAYTHFKMQENKQDATTEETATNLSTTAREPETKIKPTDLELAKTHMPCQATVIDNGKP